MINFRLFLVIPTLLFLVACAGPVSDQEFFPTRNINPAMGLLINEGTTSLNIWIYDQAGRLMEEIYLPPARDPLSPLAINQQRDPVIVAKTLAPGSYRVEYIPFYYELRFFPPQRYRVDLPRGSSSIWINRDPNAVYDYRTRRHWGWILRLHGGDMPRDPTLRNINFNLRCC